MCLRRVDSHHQREKMQNITFCLLTLFNQRNTGIRNLHWQVIHPDIDKLSHSLLKVIIFWVNAKLGRFYSLRLPPCWMTTLQWCKKSAREWTFFAGAGRSSGVIKENSGLSITNHRVWKVDNGFEHAQTQGPEWQGIIYVWSVHTGVNWFFFEHLQ